MARLGSRLGSGTTTDTTSTSNEFYYAGEAFRLAYDVGEGTGSRRVGTDFTGFTITAKAIGVAVTGGDLSTAVPYGLCKIGTDDPFFSIEANCEGTWAQEAVDLIPGGDFDISVRDGVCKSRSTLIDITAADVAEDYVNDEDTCLLLGVCKYDSAGGPAETADTTEVECLANKRVGNMNSVIDAGDWITNNTWEANGVKENGQFYVYIPSDILKLAGSPAPKPGQPEFIAYSIDYKEPSLNGDEETRVIETDVIGFRWTPMFDINKVVTP